MYNIASSIKITLAYFVIIVHIYINVFYSNNDLASLGIISITLLLGVTFGIQNSNKRPIKVTLYIFTTVEDNI